VPDHETLARRYLLDGEIAAALREEWNIAPNDAAALIAGETRDQKSRILRSMLSGPIDVDKVDYLMRDSLHAGVPYGRHFDRQRLLGSLCLNEAGDGLAITDKGKTAAEMMVFARYVMFSEVYWHHAVRAATAMLQRAVFLLRDTLHFDELVMLTERPLVERLLATAGGNDGAHELLDGLFGPTRRLYKRLSQYSYFEEPALYERLARQPFSRLAGYTEKLAAIIRRETSLDVRPHEILLDAPPMELEVEFDVEVYFSKERVYRQLGDVSPVVRTLAREQFDDYVKRVRLFVHPRCATQLRQLPNLAELLGEAIESASTS
jgi:HD superfamily phosphohydrolase